MADDDSTPPDVNTPTLELIDKGWPKPATGDLPNQDGGAGDPNALPPVVPDFSVTVQTLRDAQTYLLPTTETAVNSYNHLKNVTNSCKGWIFQQEQGGDLGESYWWNPASQGFQTQGNGPDKDIAKQTPKMEASLDNALLSIADVVHLAGDYVAYMDLAAQIYTKADKGAFLPSQ